MRKLSTLLATFIIGVLLISCSSERQKASEEKIKGTAQASVGKLTNDANLEADGKTNKTKSDLRSSKEDIKDIITGD